jgi:hypothetical protein
VETHVSARAQPLCIPAPVSFHPLSLSWAPVLPRYDRFCRYARSSGLICIAIFLLDPRAAR